MLKESIISFCGFKDFTVVLLYIFIILNCQKNLLALWYKEREGSQLNTSPDSLGQGVLEQGLNSDSFPSHFLPLFCGIGLLHLRVLLFRPSEPQVTEHSL